jgi:hypothetical protein
MKNINRRENPRMEIKLRCHVSSPAIWMRSDMYTENISRSGLLIAWRGDGADLPLPAVGQIVTIDVELPADHGFAPKCIHCQGTVTRVSQAEGDSPHVAMRVNYMDFRALHDQIRAVEAIQPVASWMA